MKLVTYQRNGEARTGALVDSQVIDLNNADSNIPTDMIALLNGGENMLDAARRAAESGAGVDVDSVQLLAPVLRPGKVICLGLNYRAHADEAGFEHPKYPVLFHKAATSLIGHQQPILIPPGATHVDYEVELAIIIGTRCKRVSEANALECVAGYAGANDVSEREWQFRTPQWTTGKMLDTFCPLGPALVTSDEVGDPNNLDIKLTLNGEVMQQDNTSDMIFNVPFTVHYISQICTLEPGDVILTGTPSGIGGTRDP
ncbi:MAG: FAA hydrolase family protein, partial [Chloroflexi bacterium]